MTRVYSPSLDNEFGVAAREIASDLSVPVDEELGGGDTDTLLYVAAPRDIDESELLTLQKRVESSNGRFTYGVITGRVPESAVALFERDAYGNDKHVLAVRKVDRDIYSTDDEAVVLTRDDVTAERIDALNEEGMASLSAMINGREIHTYITGGYLCGAPSNLDRYPLRGNQPQCVTSDGELDCPYEDRNDILPADRLHIPHVFLDSCTSMYPNASTDAPVNVGLSLLEHATDAIGAYRPKQGSAHEVAFHYALLRSGYTAGERTYLLNSHSKQIGLSAYPYVTFGDPGTTHTSPTAQAYEWSVSGSDSERELVVSDVDAHLVDIELEGLEPGVFVRCLTERFSSAPLFYSVVDSDPTPRLFVYSWGRMQAEQLRFQIASHRTRAAARDRIWDGLSNARDLSYLNLLDRKAKGQIENLRNRVRSLPDDVSSERYHTNAHWHIEEVVDGVTNDMKHLRNRIVRVFSERGPGHLEEEYSDHVVKHGVDVFDDPCPTCGNVVFTRHVTAPNDDLERISATCPKCAKVFNVPRHGERLEYPSVAIDDPGDFDTLEFGIEFTNPLDIEMETVLFPWLHHDSERVRDAATFQPERESGTLRPGESITRTFRLDVSGLDPHPHDYMIYGYVIGNLDMFVGMTGFNV